MKMTDKKAAAVLDRLWYAQENSFGSQSGDSVIREHEQAMDALEAGQAALKRPNFGQVLHVVVLHESPSNGNPGRVLESKAFVTAEEADTYQAGLERDNVLALDLEGLFSDAPSLYLETIESKLG